VEESENGRTCPALKDDRSLVYRERQFRCESWEDNISKEEQWAKINTDRKKSSYIGKDCIEKSQNYCSTGDRTAEMNIHLEHPVSTKPSDVIFTSPTSTVRLQLLNL
jgi:hypothetical protein